MPLTLETLLDLLGPTRRPVAELWAALGVERKELQAFIAAHRDALAEAGAMLHTATMSQASSPRQYVSVEGARVAALSRPVGDAPAPLVKVEAAPLAPLGALADAGRAADAAAARGVLARYRADLAAETRRAQDADLARWGRFLAATGAAGAGCAWADDPGCWAGVSWGLVEAFPRWQEAEGYSLASVARALSTVRTYAKQAARAGALTPEALRLIETGKAPRARAARNRDAGREQTRKGHKKAEAVALTRAQARALKRQPDTPQGRRDALLMALLLDHGLRIGEVADLKVTDLDLAAGRLRFYRRKVDKTQVHTLSRDALRAARRYFTAADDGPAGPSPSLPSGPPPRFSGAGAPPAAGPLLRGGAEGQPGARGELGAPGVSVRKLAARVRALGERAGVHGLSPHDCRHAWATWASESGTPVRDLQEAGGWASPNMPLRYAAAAAIANERVRLGEDDEPDAEGDA